MSFPFLPFLQTICCGGIWPAGSGGAADTVGFGGGGGFDPPSAVASTFSSGFGGSR